MPSRDVNQCCYKEGRRRCRKNGTGNPPLCNAHRIAFAEQLAPEHAADPTLGDLASEFLNGGRISLDDAVRAATGWVMGGNYGRFYPPTDATRPPRVTHTASPWQNMSPDEILHDLRQGVRSQSPPPPKPPPRDPLEQKRKEARVVLGFAPNDELDAQRIRRRHRELAMRHHPDRGGSVAKMAKINAAVDVLLG
ncbi:MAG TPA: J domain-containing protein [Galbitalea sp.]